MTTSILISDELAERLDAKRSIEVPNIGTVYVSRAELVRAILEGWLEEVEHHGD